MKAGKNTFEDDVLYSAADLREKARAKRHEADVLKCRGPEDMSVQPETLIKPLIVLILLRDDSDVAAESDNGLFLSKFPRETSSSKRAYDGSATAQSEREMNGERLDEGLDESRQSKRQATKAKREQVQELEKELQWNKLAGVEQILLAQQKKDEKEAAVKENQERKRCQQQDKTHPKGFVKTVANTSKRGSRAAKAKATKPGYLDHLRNLGFCNIYEEGNASAEIGSGPVDHATRKSDALKNLISSIPLEEDRRLANRDRANIIKASKTLGFRTVRPDGEGRWKMKGLVSRLEHYQLLSSAWMRERETGLVKPYGGLLADQMGLGKTVMTIAAMVANQASAGEQSKTTLIVATPPLVAQWMSELERHVENGVFPGVVRYHTSSKLHGTGAIFVLQSASIILTTYGEVINSYPKFEPPEEYTTLEEKLSWWDEIWEKTRGALHRIHFHRVVLDEAHAIKNHVAQTSVSCRALMAKNRWAITGTPIHNRVQELYPYFKFLRVPQAGSFETFQKNFCVPEDEDCTDRLHTFLKQFMIRRTHATRLCGKPLLQLPKNHQRTIYVEFNNVERALYNLVHKKYVQGINYFSSQGLLEEKHNLVLTMLQKLRQMTSHIFLVQDTIERFLQTAEVDDLWSMTEGEDDPSTKGQDMASAIKRMMEASNRPSSQEQGEACETEVDGSSTGPPMQPLVFKFRKFLRNLKNSKKWQDLKERSLCHKCESPPEDPWVTSCLHLYCKECLDALVHESAAREETQAACLECAVVFTESRPCEGLKELEAEESLLADERPVKRSKKDPNADVKWIDIGGDLLPSSKTAAVQVQMEQWQNEEPDKKIIVFCQWHMLFVIGPVHGEVDG